MMASTESDAEAVRMFTIAAGQKAAEKPEPMNSEEVFFLAKMMLDEIMEMCATVAAPEETKAKLKAFVEQSRDLPKGDYEKDGEKGRVRMIADQADALVDSYYYSLNAAAKKGINLSSVFGIVHGANMAKRDPETGKFLKRADGKIIKPKGWQPPDIEAEIARQIKHGSFASPSDDKEN